jgi:hypothetical protein
LEFIEERNTTGQVRPMMHTLQWQVRWTRVAWGVAFSIATCLVTLYLAQCVAGRRPFNRGRESIVTNDPL